jgi:transcriptional regulator with XRE-family HTH domain
LADAAGVDRSTAARWERGETQPQPWHRPRLAEALKVSVEEVAGLLADEPDPPSADRLPHDPERRGRVDLVAVAQLRERVYELDLRYITAPPTSLLADAAESLSQAAHLGGGAATSRVRQQLHVVQAEAAILMGQLVWDASQRRDHAAARSYFSRAAAAARCGNDPVTEGWALLRTTFVALYGEKDPKAGLALARQTAETASSSRVLAGLATLHAAEAHAMMRQRADCQRALAQGQAMLDRIGATDAAIDLFTPSHHERMVGSCYLFLGDAHRAETALEAAAERLNDGSKAHAVVCGNLSLAYLRQRKLDQAVAMLHVAIDVVERNRGGGGLNIVFSAGRELQPWRQVAAVQQVHGRLLDLLAA